jgi:cytidylate kinase
VFPDARLKVFLVASAAERAARRSRDEEAAGRPVALNVLENDIRRRDALDASRAVSPLVAAAGAVQIDTTGRTLDDVVREIVVRFEAAGAARVARPISGAQP